MVRIVFKPAATSARWASVQARVRRDPDVKSVRLITPREAFAALHKKFPALLQKPLRANPLPATLSLQPEPGVGATTFVQRYRQLRLPGVSSVERARPDGSACSLR
jgi:cell division protein FtsX